MGRKNDKRRKNRANQEEKTARAKEIAEAQKRKQLEDRHLETSSVLSFLLYLDVLIVLLQQAVVLWHVVGSEMFSFQCGQRTESLTFVSYIIGDTFRYRRLLRYVGQYGYMGLVLTLALIANFVTAKLISQGARTPVALAVLMSPSCPLSNKYLMSLCINLMAHYNVFSHSQFDIYSLLLYVIFPIVSISCAVACSFKLSSDTP